MRLLAMIFALTAGPALADMSDWVGDWAGRGFTRTDGSDTQQALRCRLAVSQDALPDTSFSGRCATTAAQRRFNFRIQKDDQGQYSAVADDLPNGEPSPETRVLFSGAQLTVQRTDGAGHLVLLRSGSDLVIDITGQRDDGTPFHAQATLTRKATP